MTLSELVQKLELKVLCGEDLLDTEVTGGYVSDLLSDVLGNARQGQVWLTLQIHVNIIAVAAMKGLAAILIVNNRDVAAETIERAKEEGVAILLSSLPTYELAGELKRLGV